jgi:hypothetical protein
VNVSCKPVRFKCQTILFCLELAPDYCKIWYLKEIAASKEVLSVIELISLVNPSPFALVLVEVLLLLVFILIKTK